MRPPFRFVGPEPSSNTIAVLEELLAKARAGEVLGMAFVAMYRAREYEVGYTGECVRSPTFTLGMLVELMRHIGGGINE